MKEKKKKTTMKEQLTDSGESSSMGSSPTVVIESADTKDTANVPVLMEERYEG